LKLKVELKMIYGVIHNPMPANFFGYKHS